jgi:hypothetical protein
MAASPSMVAGWIMAAWAEILMKWALTTDVDLSHAL